MLQIRDPAFAVMILQDLLLYQKCGIAKLNSSVFLEILYESQGIERYILHFFDMFLLNLNLYGDYCNSTLWAKSDQCMVKKLTVKTKQNVELFKFGVTGNGYGVNA